MAYHTSCWAVVSTFIYQKYTVEVVNIVSSIWTHGKRERLKAKGGVAEDEMVGWHHQVNAHEFKQTPGDSEGQGSLGCCRP